MNSPCFIQWTLAVIEANIIAYDSWTMKRYLNEGCVGLVFGIAAFCYFVFTGLTREKITSDKDLIEIEGHYTTHSFKDNKGFQNFTHQYYIWTDNYKNAFQVKADYLRIFNRKAFLTKVNQGDKVKFTIPKKLIGSLNTEKDIIVTSIVVEGSTYLDLDETLEMERNLTTSKSDYFIGTGFLIAGLFVYLRKRI